MNDDRHYLDQFESLLSRREQAAKISVSASVEISECRASSVPENFWAGADTADTGMAAH